MPRILILSLALLYSVESLSCQLSDFSQNINVTSLEWSDTDVLILEDALCQTAKFTGVARVNEILINDPLMGFEYSNRLTFQPRFRPLNSPPEFRQTLELTANVWAHEYGHAVLKNHLLDRHPDWLRYIQRSQEFALLNDEYRICMSERCPRSMELIEKILKFWQDGEEEKANLFTTIYNVYDEMYADIVAVLYANSPSAMSDAFYFPGENYDYYVPSLRDLSIDHPLNEERNGQYHGVMAFSRHWIWKNMICNHDGPLTLEEKSSVLMAIEKAIESEVERRLASSTGTETSAEINLAFTKHSRRKSDD